MYQHLNENQLLLVGLDIHQILIKRIKVVVHLPVSVSSLSGHAELVCQ